MQFTYVFTVLLLVCVSISQAKPVNNNNNNNAPKAIYSSTDISGEAVRQKRGCAHNYQGDYFIYYPSSQVYANANPQYAARDRSDDSVYQRRSSVDNSFEARKDRADRERAAFTDSFGK